MKIPTTSFTLQSGDSSLPGFVDRQKALFDQLSQAEKDCNKDQSTPIDARDFECKKFRRPPPPGKRRKNEARQFRGKESIFKQVSLPSPFANHGVPDYHKNPQKWTKYSLDDVNEADMSDKKNTQAALAFLKGLRARRSKDKLDFKQTDMQVDDQHNCAGSSNRPTSSAPQASQVVFRKPTKQNDRKNKKQTRVEIVEADNNPIFVGSKIIFPEYVVGQKPINKSKKEKQNPVIKVDRSKQIKLDHLQEYEDE
ncbi:GSCOCG00009767001-RA-CDS [Cotesia congregata]|uniref:U5 small nuclear ribonucleoprotein TSSC4 n=1 Tax=Cotesia congregata TaxID=51543 RepID=A0A8J2MIV9_COTCN|nr:GSCOCG00009767001-RA-CDS [Cotesia congregata]CAG5088487.1 Similar to Tssc4: Protein TSSC4 (Rattus norvegicus) [Cotesia congregata]